VNWDQLDLTEKGGLPTVPRGIGEGFHFAIEVKLRLRLLEKIIHKDVDEVQNPSEFTV